MADDTSNLGPADQARINMNEGYEVRYWTANLKCTEAELRATVKTVGVMAAEVRAYIAKNRRERAELTH